MRKRQAGLSARSCLPWVPNTAPEGLFILRISKVQPPQEHTNDDNCRGKQMNFEGFSIHPAQDGKRQRWLAKLTESTEAAGVGAKREPFQHSHPSHLPAAHPQPGRAEKVPEQQRSGTCAGISRGSPHRSEARGAHVPQGWVSSPVAGCLQATATNPTGTQAPGEAKHKWNQPKPWKAFRAPCSDAELSCLHLQSIQCWTSTK